MGIKLIKKTNEAAYTAIKNPEQAAFLIDCGTPEKAKELNDAFYKVAFVGNGGQYNKAVIGGELIQGWNVGQFFTACVDPCDKAAKWCEEWLRNSNGAVPGIQGNDAGLESKSKRESRPKATDGRVHQFVFDFVITGNDTLSDVEDRIRNEIDLIDGIAKVSNGDSETYWPETEYFGESNGSEALSPKMQKRRKFKTWQANSLKLKGFEEAGYSFLDLCHNGGYTFDEMGVPTKCYDSKEAALAGAKKNFDDFDEYLDVSAIYDEAGGPDGEAVWFPSFKLKDSFADLPEGEGLEVLSELSDTLYRMYTKGESTSEDRRGTDRYGHHVKRFTTNDLKGLGDGDGDGEEAPASNGPEKFGLAYLDTIGMDAFGNSHNSHNRDLFLHYLADMPVSKDSIEKLLKKYPLRKYGNDPVFVRDFFPDSGTAYLGTMAPDGVPYKTLCLRWGPSLKK